MSRIDPLNKQEWITLYETAKRDGKTVSVNEVLGIPHITRLTGISRRVIYEFRTQQQAMDYIAKLILICKK